VNKEFNIEQIVSYLTGNCSKDEQEIVEQWINLSKDNALLFEEFKQVWDLSTVKRDSCIVDIEKSWNNFKELAHFDEEVHIEIEKTSVGISVKGMLYHATRIAALIIIVLGLYWVFNNDQPVKTINFTSTIAQVDSPFVLPDGSDVTMNNGASIDYPEQFSTDVRNLSFKGEAFFDVVSNPAKPMVIALDNVRVKVLGTSFNLCNCKHSDEITVYLETGKILFYSLDETDGSVLEQIILYPGQKGIYNKNTGLITKHQFTDNNHLAWKTGSLEFVNAPLTDVIKVLEKTYEVKISSETPLVDYSLTARFNNESTESIFESLQVIYGFNYEITDNSIVIY